MRWMILREKGYWGRVRAPGFDFGFLEWTLGGRRLYNNTGIGSTDIHTCSTLFGVLQLVSGFALIKVIGLYK